MTTAMKNDYITISIKKSRLKAGLQILGLIVTIVLSYKWYTFNTTGGGFFLEILRAHRIAPFIGSFIVVIIGSILGMLLFNRKKIPLLNFVICVAYSTLMVLFQIRIVLTSFDPTFPGGMESLNHYILVGIFTLVLGIVLGIISLLIAKVRKNKKQLSDHSIHSTPV